MLKGKNKSIILFLISILNLPLFSQANSSQIFFGGNYTYEHFKPKENPSFHGNLGGIQARYEYKIKNSIYEGIKLIYRTGELQGSAGKRIINDVDGQGNIGYTINHHSFLITPFTGFGWRYIYHKLKQTEIPSLTFVYNEIYIPVGIETDYRINSFSSIGLRGTWMPQIFSSVDTKPIGNVRWALTLPLGNVMIELPITFDLSQKKIFWYLELKPFFQYWQDGKSKASTARDTSLDIPGNISILGGAEINFGWSF
jgi:hypothetical protein